MHIKLKRAPAIYLAGFMASGKSTVGRIVANRLGWEFVDVDTEIESEQGKSIAVIFEQQGETEFRRLESAAITRHVRLVERGMPCVIALGGGAFVQPENFDLIRNHGISIYINCSFDVITGRLAADGADRPLARDPQRLRELFDARQTGYSLADFHIEGNCAPESIAQAVLALPIWK